MKLTAKATLQIQKPAAQVFEAIVNPELMTKYFISQSTGRLEPGQEIHWQFPEFPEGFPVKAIQTERNRSVSFIWDKETTVNIALEEVSSNSTVVRVTEGEKEFSEKNAEWAIGNTEGWANFLACMKAYLEYGIQLRKGAFDFMTQEEHVIDDKPARTAIIEKQIEINTEPDQVWRVFTDPTLSRQIGGEYVTDWKVGNSIGWKGLNGTLHTNGTLIQIEPGKLFQYRQFDLDDPRHLLATITYRFKSHEGKTLLQATEELHSALSREELAGAAAGWDIALGAVKETAENI